MKREPKKSKKVSNKPLLYDYWKGDKTILSHDGKHPNVVILPNFSENTFMEMGIKNFLTGEALKDYINLVNKGEK